MPGGARQQESSLDGGFQSARGFSLAPYSGVEAPRGLKSAVRFQESFHNGGEPTLYPPHDFPQSPHNPTKPLLHPNPAASRNNRCMIIRKSSELRYSDVTPKNVYLNRRRFLAAGTAAFAAFGRAEPKLTATSKSPFNTDEKLTPLQIITGYNNYYEFGTSKDDPAKNATRFQTNPWTLSVEGAVAKPLKFDHDQLMKIAPLEEAIYRHRCVEAWSIVVPWIGFSLSALLKQAQPTAKAKYRGFRNLSTIPSRCRSRRPAAPVSNSLCGRPAPGRSHASAGAAGCRIVRRSAAPTRTARPCVWWCRGSTVSRASSRWSRSSWWKSSRPPPGICRTPSEYGFYSNVNPEVDHPRWSQATRTPPGRIQPPQDPEVQRLRRPGSQPLHRHGPPQELLVRVGQPILPAVASAHP